MARSEYSTGCRQYGVAPQQLGKDGELRKWEWFDETRLESLDKEIAPLSDVGGPCECAPTIN